MQNYPSDLLDQFHTQLEKAKKDVTSRIAELRLQDPFADPGRANDNAASDTEASELSGHERVSALIEEVKMQHIAIDAALARIADGSYGVCSHCHQRIPLERLRILPTATVCVDCE